MIMYSRIIIELDNVCNRRCCFCIRKYIKDNEYMNEKTFDKIIEQIKDNIELFEKPLIFSLFKYNEPFVDINRTEYFAKKIKENFSDSYIYIHSNGDLINTESINKINNIDTVYINDYDNIGLENILNKIQSLKINNIKSIINIENERGQIITKYNNTNYIFYINSSIEYINFRSKCSTLNNDNIRDYACNMKNKILSIEANGDIMICCDGNNKLHKDLIIGNINSSELSKVIGKELDEYNTKSCKYCNMKDDSCDLYGGKKQIAMIYKNL